MLSENVENFKEMGFLDHIIELRSTIIWILAAWLGSSIVLWFFSGYLLDDLREEEESAGSGGSAGRGERGKRLLTWS